MPHHLKQLAQRVSVYFKDSLIGKKNIRNLEFISKTTSINSQEVANYVGALKRIDTALDCKLDNKYKESNQFETTLSDSISLTGYLGILGYAIGSAGNPYTISFLGIPWIIYSTFKLGWALFITQDFSTPNFLISQKRYLRKLENHYSENAESLDQDIKIALTYAHSLQDQLEKPQINVKYLNRLEEVEAIKNECSNYFRDVIIHLERMKKISGK